MNIPKFWKSSLGFSFFTFVSRIFGYLRDLVLSSNLGASTIHDIFVVIFRIPNVFRSFFGEGAMSQSLVPSIIEANQHQTRFLNQVFTLLLCILALFVLCVELFPAFFVTLFAPGYLADLDTLNNSTNFLRLIFPYILLISLVAFFGAIQNSKKYFQVVAATPIIFNITLILFALSFSNLTLGVIGASILIAGALQLILNVLYTAKLGYLPAFDFTFDASLLQTFFNRLLPAIFAAGIYQINILVDTIFASFLVTGSPTWLYLSERIIQLPLGMFGVAIALVSLPNITELFKDKKSQELLKSTMTGFASVSLIGFGAFLGLYFLSEPIIQMLFQRGEFLYSDTLQTSSSLLAYAFGLPFLMSNKFFSSIYFAVAKTKLVLWLGVFSLLLNIIFNYVFVYMFELEHVGIALATSIASIFVFTVSVAWLSLNKFFNKGAVLLAIAFIIFIAILISNTY